MSECADRSFTVADSTGTTTELHASAAIGGTGGLVKAGAGVLRLSGATVFVAGAVGGLVAGIPGAIFALPLVAAVAAIRRPPTPAVAKRRVSARR